MCKFAKNSSLILFSISHSLLNDDGASNQSIIVIRDKGILFQTIDGYTA